MASIRDAVGSTPLVHLGGPRRDGGAEVYLKLEYLNPGGSHKARAARAMLTDLERRGELVPGSGQTLVVATGGNLGICTTLFAGSDYHVVLVVPDTYSPRRVELLRALGAEIVVAETDPDSGRLSHTNLALRLQLQHPDWMPIDQFVDPMNAEGHRSTGYELLAAPSGRRIDFFIGGVGSGGSITGIGEVLKEANPRTSVVAVQPAGCDILADRFVAHSIEGLAVGLRPPGLNLEVIDRWVSVTMAEARAAALRLLREEGIAVGPSTGANVHVALRIAAVAAPGARIVTLAYDGLH
ncbi:MAG: PLP-dependent cysteine synthase family protein, partial [Actinomycetota bacterium]